jgi:hypothetical protein
MGAHNVYDGIHGAHLMKMDILDVGAVNLGLGPGQPSEYCNACLLHPIGQGTGSDNLFDVGQVPVMITVVFFIDDDHCLTAAQTALNYFFKLQVIVVDVQLIQFRFQRFQG